MDVPATRLFSGADRAIRDNVVLRHGAGLITDISEPAARPDTAPRSLILPAFVNAHDHARPRGAGRLRGDDGALHPSQRNHAAAR